MYTACKKVSQVIFLKKIKFYRIALKSAGYPMAVYG